MVIDSLSTVSSPAATDRSPEDQDLLERSTKKAKRGRDAVGTTAEPSPKQVTMESPTEPRAFSPESSQWRTPVITPNQVWNRRESFQPTEEAEESDDDTMEEDGRSFDYPVIKVTKEEKKRLRRPWRRSLILRVLGRTVGYSFLLQRLQRMCKTQASFDLIALTNDCYIAKFETLADYEAVKLGGPWMVLDHYLITQVWRPNFDPRSSRTDKILAWIRFPSLPIEYFDEEFLKKIRISIGKPIKIDVTTGLASKGKLARVCVELDITKPLLSNFVINMTEWPIEYEGIHYICFKCGVYGHRTDLCGKDAPPSPAVEENSTGTSERPPPAPPVQKPKEK
ncbi:PREDICTED: uncharacterized protein LOC109169367 [Ipomoea nil]|uniref:uncharacterized protein LOC109169367 n=1 Tax=Ipomoea nil TaxID=35883 RepID=UPI0009015A13|nr:PREDICTED: uncharacterized protein LOC109169367 [Ipomoea nil]